MKMYTARIKNEILLIGVKGGDIFNLSTGSPIKIRTKHRMMTWLYDHDAFPV